MVGLRSQSVMSVIEPPLFEEVHYSVRHSASYLFMRANKMILCSAPRITKLSHPPTLGGGRAGPAAIEAAQCTCTRPSYLSFHPSRATTYKSDLPLSYCSIALLLCSLLIPLCGVGSTAVQRRPPRSKQSYSFKRLPTSKCGQERWREDWQAKTMMEILCCCPFTLASVSVVN